MIQISEKESKTSHGTYRDANEQESGIDCPQGVVIGLRSLLFFAAGLALYFKVGLTDQPSRGPRLITLTENLIKRDVTKSETNNWFIHPSHGPQSDIALGNHTLCA